MKNKIIIIIFLLIITGCTAGKTNKLVISPVNTKIFENNKVKDYEILRIDNQYIYINSLNTLSDPFLFTSEKIILVDLNGEVENEIKINAHKRVVDFILENNSIYYLTLVNKDNNYLIELCTLDNNKEVIIKDFAINNPFSYPKFEYINNDFYFKVNNVLYKMTNGNPNEVFTFDNEEVFLARQDQADEKFYYKTINNDEYQLYCIDDGVSKRLDFNADFGNFIVHNDIIIYINNKDRFLYCHDLKTKNKKILYDKEKVFDFRVLESNQLVISTDIEILLLDLENNKITDKIIKTEGNGLYGSVGWLYSNGSEFVIASNKKIHRFKIN